MPDSQKSMPRDFEHAADERLHVDVQVEHQVRRDGEPVQVPQPLAIDAAHAGARQRGEDVAVRQDDEAGLERRDDLLLEPVGEVGRVEQHERELVERVAGFGELDRRLHQRRSRPAGLDDAVTFDLEPLAQQLDLRAAPDAVGPFDRDELARIAADIEVGDAPPVVPAGLAAAVGAFERQIRRARHQRSPFGSSAHVGRSACARIAAAR